MKPSRCRNIRRTALVPVLLLILAWSLAWAEKPGPGRGQGQYTGSQSCRECHEKFYKLWEPSHHGKAMQAYDDAFAAANLAPQKEPLTVRGVAYLARTGPGQGYVEEVGKGREKRYPIVQALGGKNIFYFLTPLDRGRLQTLPLAYDIKERKWFDTAKSGLRHAGDEPVDWRDASYTFNTSCHGCHVSQYSQNYDPKTGSYSTTWKEPGINCETCHGPGEAHIRVCREAPQGTVPQDLKMVRGGRSFTPEQNNAACSSCHAKSITLTRSFMPGDSFWDHYGLATLENADYYPDGRDLGENYTFTSWLMSPCVRAGKLDCLHCHTSSGRFRQKDGPNQACAACHAERVKNPEPHIRHKAGPGSPTCVSCHMPTTSFANMRRSDHSMLPPAPAATLKFGSPNACNLCHKDKDAAWADKAVRQWRERDYQAPVLFRAGLIDAARKRDWSQLAEMLDYLNNWQPDQVSAASLIQLLRGCQEQSKWETVLRAAQDPSPLVRAAALESLGDAPSPDTARVLLAALGDKTRLVRIRAAQGLAGYPEQALPPEERARLQSATREMLESFSARPDTWQAHFNLGNHHLDLGRPEEAIQAYQAALKQEPRAVLPMVNLAMMHVQSGNEKEAEKYLRQAVENDPANAVANFNLGLLLAGQEKKEEAERLLRAAFKADPGLAPAAYNLSLLIQDKHPQEAVAYCQQAFDLNPNPRYAFTLGYLMNRGGDWQGAVNVLELAAKRWPGQVDALLLLADIYEGKGYPQTAASALENALAQGGLPPGDQGRLAAKLRDLREKAP